MDDKRSGSGSELNRTRRVRRGNPLAGAAVAGVGVEIVASICGVGAVGWVIDYFAGTGPWGLVIGLILGLIGGMYNSVSRALRILGSTSGYERRHDDQQRD